MTKFIFLLTLAAVCCVSIYHTEVRLLSSTTTITRNHAESDTILSSISVARHQTLPERYPGQQKQHQQRQRITKTIHWHGKQDLKIFMRAYFDDENLMCRHVLDDVNANKTTQSLHTDYIFNVTFNCRALFETAGLGTGNFMAGLYAMRLAARALTSSSSSSNQPDGRIQLVTSCDDAHDERGNLILPWLMGEYDSGHAGSHGDGSGAFDLLTKSYSNQPSLQQEACKHIDKAPIGLLYPEMQYELRRMAVQLVGVPPSDHAMHGVVQRWIDRQRQSPQSFPNNQYTLGFDADSPPLYTNVSLDDAILHFRCGDLMDSNHPRFGFLNFQAFRKHIPPTAKSIGIVTQPFSGSSNTVRALDASETKRYRCQVVVAELISYLQAHFPKARIQLHNSPDETIALTYARMILAEATIAGISTFGVFASIASFGTGYIRRPDEKSATNEWLIHPKPLDGIMQAETARDAIMNQEERQLVLMDEPDILMVRRVRELWLKEKGQEKIVKWFRGETAP